jgi:hypothetical protein
VAKQEETLQNLGAMQMVTIWYLSEERKKSRHKRRLANRQGQESKGTYNNNKNMHFFFAWAQNILTTYLPTYLPTYLLLCLHCNLLQLTPILGRSSADQHQ